MMSVAVKRGVVRGMFGRSMSTLVPKGTDMACFQCEQTAEGTGCTTIGVCGKEPTTASLQDLIVHQSKAVACWANAAFEKGLEADLEEVNRTVIRSLFSTLTNVNFDSTRFPKFSADLEKARQVAKEVAGRGGVTAADVPAVAEFVPVGSDVESLSAAGHAVGLEARGQGNEDVFGASELVVYGIKGVAAYASHALELGEEDVDLYRSLYRALSGVSKDSVTVEEALGHALDVGGANVTAMMLLDRGHNNLFGAPTPSEVNLAPTEGKAILISGHDMADLEALLKQTEGKGINVYTHGEMLPAHGYPGLRKYKHLAGHYGKAWNLQQFEWRKFPGPVVVTTNCLMPPRKSYRDRLWTMNEVGWEDIPHIKDRDFSSVIDKALEMEGFPATEPREVVTTGFGHNAVLGVADKLLQAIQSKDLQQIVLIGGCDGSESERSFYTDLADKLPQEAAMLTLGCAKFRLLGRKDYGNIPNTGIPRLLDMGQCNDAASAIIVATKLAEALDTNVNALPLHFRLSWLEQKAVAVLLSLLHLNIQGVHIGPRPPAFITPNILSVLQDKFDLKLIGSLTPEEDAKQIMQQK